MAERTHSRGDLPALARWRAEGARWSAAGSRSRLERPAHWGFDELSGRLTELSGLGASAQLSLAFALIRDAQGRGEPVAWLTVRHSTFFPPDAALCGVDLASLPVVFVPHAPAAARAAERLARSGAFGLLVLDLVGILQAEQGAIPAALQSRLAGLALRHDIAVLCLTEKAPDAASLGPLVSLRAAAQREGAAAARPEDPHARYRCRLQVLKDKQRGPGWEHAEVFFGPDGLR